ncbi:MAG: hypothetical protein K9N51_12810, partial [Candidatus Pacebacteria bacterium]|nr:hypothetical protein [Candidatus Paceibacterota bacterium]
MPDTAVTAKWSDLEAIEELFMNAADGDPGALAALAEAVRAYPDGCFTEWPSEAREVWHAGADLTWESVAAAGLSEQTVSLVYQFARMGYDSRSFRDVLANAVRFRFSDYSDPAGLLTAFEVHNPDASCQRVARRWDVFVALVPGARCWHSAQGRGIVDCVDALNNDVRIMFRRTLDIPLRQALDTLHVVRNDSPLQRILDQGDGIEGQSTATDDSIKQLVRSITPPTNDSGILKAFLVPDVISEDMFKTLAAPEQDAMVQTAEDGDDASRQRAVAHARSVVELRELFRGVDHLEFTAEDIDNIRSLLTKNAARRDQAERLCETLAVLWQLAGGSDWLVQTLKNVGDTAPCWSAEDLFVRLTDGMRNKILTDHWLAASAPAFGLDRFVALAAGLPYRLWGTVEKVVRQNGGSERDLAQKVTARVSAGDGSCGMLLWLWRRDTDETDTLRDLPALLRALGRPTKGSFIKASKDLRKILIRDEAFHRFLLAGCDTDAAESVVRTINHSAVLDSAEKQAFLVRLVRALPELRPIIEKLTKHARGASGRRSQPQVTSRRSYMQRQRELQKIIQVKIPENSRAIAHARSYGDLRENAEYKAAKEEQALLAIKRAELENALETVRTTDFSEVTQPLQVVPGSTVELELSNGDED